MSHEKGGKHPQLPMGGHLQGFDLCNDTGLPLGLDKLTTVQGSGQRMFLTAICTAAGSIETASSTERDASPEERVLSPDLCTRHFWVGVLGELLGVILNLSRLLSDLQMPARELLHKTSLFWIAHQCCQ